MDINRRWSRWSCDEDGRHHDYGQTTVRRYPATDLRVEQRHWPVWLTELKTAPPPPWSRELTGRRCRPPRCCRHLQEDGMSRQSILFCIYFYVYFETAHAHSQIVCKMNHRIDRKSKLHKCKKKGQEYHAWWSWEWFTGSRTREVESGPQPSTYHLYLP